MPCVPLLGTRTCLPVLKRMPLALPAPALVSTFHLCSTSMAFAWSKALENPSTPSLFFSANTQLNATSTTCPLLPLALSFAQHKYGVVREYVGHGVGKAFHSAPSICHFRNTNNEQMQLWQTFTIEPMLVQVRKTE